MKIELGGGSRPRGDGFVNIDTCAGADLHHDLNVIPWPIPDESVEAVYSSHCLEHLAGLDDAFDELCRICRVDAAIEIRMPHPQSQMAMCWGHRHVFSPVEATNREKYFPKLCWKKQRRMRLDKIVLQSSFMLEEAKSEIPLLRALSDEQIMKWIPGTCHECCYFYTVIANEFL